MPEHDLLELAAAQHGLFTRGDARRHGLSDHQIRYRVRQGRWERIAKGVYRVEGTVRSWANTLVAACLVAGAEAAASHRSAGRVWEVPRFAEPIIEITTPRHSVHRVAGAIVHECCLLREEDVTTVKGIPVVRPELLLIQLAGLLGARRVDGVVDDVLRMKLTTLEAIHERLDAIGRSGRDGVGILRTVLDIRSPHHSRTQSKLERAFMTRVVDGKLAEPSLQHEVRDPRGFIIGHIDVAWPQARLAVEIDSREHHEALGRWTSDLERQNKLVQEGWTILRFTWWDVHERAAWVTQQIQRQLEHQSRILAAVGGT